MKSLTWMLLFTFIVAVSGCNQEPSSTTTIAVGQTTADSPDSAYRQRIQQFLSMLHGKPTLADYQTVKGYSDFAELQLFWKHCAKTITTVPLQDDACFNALTKNWVDKATAPSYYLRWLQTQIPNTSNISLLPSPPTTSNTALLGTSIQVILDQKKVTFWLTADAQQYARYGEIQVTHIDGVPIHLLREQQSEASVLMAIGLKAMVRPLTQAESDAQQQQQQARCDADAACVKMRAEQLREQTLQDQHAQYTQRMATLHEAWCEKNVEVCDKESEAQQKNNEQRWALEALCEKNVAQCVPKVAQWLTKKDALSNSFCAAHKKECQQLANMEQQQQIRNKAHCTLHPKDCVTQKTAFDQAIGMASAPES